MKITVIGSHHMSSYKSFTNSMYDILAAEQPHFLLSAPGVAFGFVMDYCRNMGHPVTIYSRGLQGDHQRQIALNRLVIEECDLLLAFYDGEDKGIRGALDLAEKLGKKIEVVMVKGQK